MKKEDKNNTSHEQQDLNLHDKAHMISGHAR